MTRTLEFRALHGDVTDAQIHRRRCRQLLAVGCSCPGNGPAALAPIPGRFRQRPCPLRRRSHREHGVLRRRFYPLVRVALNYCCRLSGYTATHNTLSDDRDFSLLPDRKQSSSCLCSARMNAWLFFLPGRPATSIERLHLLQRFWSAHEALLVVLAIDRRETYRFLNAAIDSSVSAGAKIDRITPRKPAETTEAFLEGHIRAFAYFGGVPTSILYDNTKLAVVWILGDGTRQKTRAFSELQSHYLFAEKFGRPAKGNDKGNVEGLVGYARRNFLVPVPRFASWEALNAYLREQCRQRHEQRVRGDPETIGERFARDRAAFLPLPVSAYEACEKRVARVSSMSLVRYRTNDYSVPSEYGHRDVLV